MHKKTAINLVFQQLYSQYIYCTNACLYKLSEGTLQEVRGDYYEDVLGFNSSEIEQRFKLAPTIRMDKLFIYTYRMSQWQTTKNSLV